jgi:protein arginine N-methyltransferase 1
MSKVEPPAAVARFPFHPDEPLQRLPELTIHLRSDGSTVFQDRGVQEDAHTLRVLEIFARPTSLRAAMATLKPELLGSQDWVDVGNTILGLCTLGILDSVERSTRKPSSPAGFDAPVTHINMLNDRARTEAYLRAIPDIVRPGDVVVEIGTGTGVLAMAAARAGANHVYTIEAGQIGRAAQTVFAANGLADRITLVSGLSTNSSLPERGDVLVSEIIGSDPLEERVLESTRDAIQRLLKPKARFVPRTLRIHAVPVRVPEQLFAGYFFVESAWTRWADWYGMDFAPIERGNASRALRIFVQPHIPRDWIQVSEPVLIAEIDLASGHFPRVECESQVVATRRETINGVMTYFDLGLSPAVELSTNPNRVDEASSWRLPVWLVSKPLAVEPGDALTLRYAYPSRTNDRVTISR